VGNHVRSLLCVSLLATAAYHGRICFAADVPPAEGLILWLDAEDVDADGNAENHPDNNSPIERWSDKSGRGNHVTQKTSERRPTFQTDQLGGRPVIRFHGDDLLDLDRLGGLATGDQQFHVLIVMRGRSETSHASQRLIDLNSRDDAEGEFPKRTGFWVGFQSSRRKVRLGIHHGDQAEGQKIAWNDEPNLIETVYAGEQAFAIHFNGARDQRAVFNGTHFLGFRQQVTLALGQHYGAESSESTFFEGDMAEVLVYDRPLTATERFEAGRYLADKYSLATQFRPIPRFEEDVQPILAGHCHGCHGEEAQEAELDLRSVSAMLRGGKAGPVIVRGFPNRSEMIAMIEANKMPPEDEPRLTTDEIETIRRWVEADAPSQEKVIVTAPATKITDEQRAHWAYQKLAPYEPPQVHETGRIKNAVDRFVLSKLEQKDLSYSAEADRATLIRRAYFDVTGLPPSPEGIDEFLADDKPGAFERLVDRLLESPHFGERWGRHWLDVSGYVDMYGSDNDAAIIKPLEGKWRFRDYVIRSFNENKPFDRFLTEQLAGDELFDWRSADDFTPEMLEALTATGFLLSANDDTDQNELNTPDVRHHVLQRTTELVVNNLLALTLQCTKCHDHKYEAISQYDYYSMESIFAPAFNVRHWVVSTGKSRADVSDKRKAEVDRQNSELDAEVAALEKRAAGIREPYRSQLFEENLQNVPAADRAAVRGALLVAADKRNDQQKGLAAKYEATVTVKPEQIDKAISEPHRTELDGIASQVADSKKRRPSYERIQVVHEANTPPPTYVLRRGNYLRPGLEVQPALLTILHEPGDEASASSEANTVRPEKSSGRRLALARQLTDGNALSGQYVARVIVNRLWQQVFGNGIVETSDNFGVSGSRPTHPQLLDWLTSRFIEGGWQVKPIIKVMMMSHAYRQTSKLGEGHAAAGQADPGNTLLWRMNLRRLDSEYVRDAILSASGKLDRSLYGTFVPLDVRPDGMVVIKKEGLPTPTYQWRRSVYVLARRNYHLTMLRIFDQPIVARNCTVRQPSAVVTQALTLLHDDFVLEHAGYFARRVAQTVEENPSQEHVTVAYRIAMGREPTTEEARWCHELVERQADRFTTAGETSADAQHKALSQLCKMLFNSSEFLYVQ